MCAIGVGDHKLSTPFMQTNGILLLMDHLPHMLLSTLDAEFLVVAI
jgi:hypothetical protein